MTDAPAPPDDLLDRRSPMPEPPLREGDHAPWFAVRSDVNPRFKFSTLGGKRSVLSFVPSLRGAQARAFMAGAHRFDGERTGLMLATMGRTEEDMAVDPRIKGVRHFFDPERWIAALFLGQAEAASLTTAATYVIDARLRICAVVREKDPAAHAAAAFAALDALPAADPATPAERQAPVLIVPDVFERAFCTTLVQGFDADGGHDSGFMVERDGRTVLQRDHAHKRRSDWDMTDTALIKACHVRLYRRLKPEIARAFQFDATRIERNTVGRYDESGGYFRPHRDNTTRGTQHRRFAVSLNLNAEDYEGGDLVFPEFGSRRFRPPTGGACVFSCSLLHEATPVTRGVRYVYVPFLYDDAAAEVRRQNLQYIDR